MEVFLKILISRSIGLIVFNHTPTYLKLFLKKMEIHVTKPSSDYLS